jgi:hypothetical protein
MGGGRILAAYLALWLLILAAPFLRRRVLLIPGTHLASAHLLLAAAILLDAAVFPSGIAKLPVPLWLSFLAAILARALRDFWLLLGPGEERAPVVLEELCARKGIDLAARDGGVVLKRLGTGVRRVGLIPGAGLVRLDRRRREPELDRIGREWGRILWRSGGGA